MSEQKPHKHKNLIIAWANGEQIQYREPPRTEWADCGRAPQWLENTEYRIKPKKWEPKEGEFTITSEGVIDSFRSRSEAREFGLERSTEYLAERSYKELRAYARLLAYRDEFCPEYEPNWKNNSPKCYVYLDTRSNAWDVSNSRPYVKNGTAYFPHEVAVELARKLNSGEVEL